MFLSVSSMHAFESTIAEVDRKVIISAKWGSNIGEIGELPGRLEGRTAGESIYPIKVDYEGYIYIGDSVNHRIYVFYESGKLKQTISLESEKGYWYFSDISIHKSKRIYALTSRKLFKINPDGSVNKAIKLDDLLEKSDKPMYLQRLSFSGVNNRVLVDDKEVIWLLGNDLVKMSNQFKILKRWGPDMSNFFVDNPDKIFVKSRKVQQYDSNGNLVGSARQYDKTGAFIGTGWGFDEKIRWPEYKDGQGNLYGFSPKSPNNLIRYNQSDKKIVIYPYSVEDTIEESWTVDLKGNVFYTDSFKDEFKVIRMSVVGK